jgi:glyoxylase-like metal-dependent hydrolase (beta-lactamase superfamily II)
MRTKLGVLFAVLALMVGTAAAQDARSVLQAADRAMGASAVRSVQYSGTGWMATPGQSFAADGDWPRADLQSYTNTIDYNSKSAKEELLRVQGNNPPRGGGGQPIQGQQRVSNFVSGNYAWNLNQQNQPNPQPNAAEVRQFMIWLSPHGFVKAGIESGNATLADRHFAVQGRTLKVVGFTTMGKYRVTGEFNDQNLLERVVTWIPNPVMGDMQVEIRYSDYRDVGGGAKFPFRVHAHQGDHPLLPTSAGRNWMDLRISNASVNVANAAVTVPDNVRNAPAPQLRVTAERLGNGVYLMGGGSHNSVAVEFRDFIAVVEGPLDDARSNAVIAEVKKAIPNKPIRYLVNTHHHFDHLGGVRTYVAEGATVITQDRNRELYERVIFAPQVRTLSPDRLALFPFATTGPGPIPLETFPDRYAISDGQRTLLAYHVQNLNHNENMLIVYLPQERIVINADLWSPPAQGAQPPANISQSAVSLFNNIRRLKLDVAQHVPIHGNPGPHADFERLVGPAAAQAPTGGAGGG